MSSYGSLQNHPVVRLQPLGTSIFGCNHIDGVPAHFLCRSRWSCLVVNSSHKQSQTASLRLSLESSSAYPAFLPRIRPSWVVIWPSLPTDRPRIPSPRAPHFETNSQPRILTSILSSFSYNNGTNCGLTVFYVSLSPAFWNICELWSGSGKSLEC